MTELRIRPITFLIINVLILSNHSIALSQIESEQPNIIRHIDYKARKEILGNIIGLLDNQYAYPDVAPHLEAFIRARIKSGAYNDATAPEKFAKAVTEDLQRINHDQHLEVSYDPVRAASLETMIDKEEPKPKTVRPDEDLVRANYYFKKVERLDGNVGYLDLRGFGPVEDSKKVAAPAMSLLADSDAVIIDLRHN